MAGDERRQQILCLAMDLFARRGFRGTTTKEIAQAAGVSEAMVFRHFATKEELYHAILDQKACADGMQDPCELLSEAIARKDDQAVFEQLAMAMMQHHEHDTQFLRLLTHAALEGHELKQMFWERSVRPLYEFLCGYIRERQQDGVFRDVDPVVVVRAFAGMIIHHSLNNTLWDTERSLLQITNEQAASEFTNILLQGIQAASARPRHEQQRRTSVRAATKKKQTR
jgi:AcrR family transcriptional regulator